MHVLLRTVLKLGAATAWPLAHNAKDVKLPFGSVRNAIYSMQGEHFYCTCEEWLRMDYGRNRRRAHVTSDRPTEPHVASPF